MKITFCGHAEILERNEIAEKISHTFKTEISDERLEFYLGAYGEFDHIALKACVTYKSLHPLSKIYFITPYPEDKYLKSRNLNGKIFDGIIYPPIETVPKKYAIIERNKWMVNQADLVIAYVNHSWGGAAKTFDYAFKAKKRYVNLGTYDPKNYFI
ncbi:MAG: hypothetical protein NC131_05345 [Roseburia sp.]|nr:hypothetical protein [Roseburia sp.]